MLLETRGELVETIVELPGPQLPGQLGGGPADVLDPRPEPGVAHRQVAQALHVRPDACGGLLKRIGKCLITRERKTPARSLRVSDRKEDLLKAAQELGYVPNQIARSLRTRIIS